MHLGARGIVCFSLVACAGPDAYTRFASEAPPCRLPPLTDRQVHDVVVRSGRSSQIDGLPEPIWRVREIRCVYSYEQSAFYYQDQPVPLNTIDGVDWVLVSRDGKVF
jgi:hypothetical protein